ERRARRATDSGARKHPRPVGDAVGVDNADLETTVLRTRVLERLDTREQVADVADEDAARLAGVPGCSVDGDRPPERPGAQGVRARPDIRGAAEPVLEPAVGFADHRSVEAGAGHDPEALTVEAADVELAALAPQPDRDGASDVLRDVEVRGEQVRGA